MNPRGTVSSSTRWMGSKVTASSWMFTISASAYRAGCVSSSDSGRFRFICSQQRFAAARLWFPSPIAKRTDPSGASSAAVSRSAASPVTRLPRMCPPPSISSKS